MGMSQTRSQREIFDSSPVARMASASEKTRANDLNGTEWIQNSVSIWSDIRKTPEELKLGHPAMFPVALVRKLLKCFTNGQQRVVLDPFLGSGSTLIAAMTLGKGGVGFDISDDYIDLARLRLSSQVEMFGSDSVECRVIKDDARNISNHLQKETVDICITSPPYWNILSQKRTADYKEIKDYDVQDGNLGSIDSYQRFLRELVSVFEGVNIVLKKSSYCIVNIMDIRKRSKFYPLHSDFARAMEDLGFIYDDLIIWDRRHEYNNFRPLGYPAVFRVNRAHEYLLIFQKKK